MSEGQGWETLVLNFFLHTAWLFLTEHLPCFGSQQLQDEPQPWEHWDELCKRARELAPSCSNKQQCPAANLSPKTPPEMLPLLSTQAKCNPWTGTCHELEKKGCWAASWQQILGDRGTFIPPAACIPGLGEQGSLAGFPRAGRATQASWAVLPKLLLLEATAFLACIPGPFCPSDRHSVCPRRGGRPNPAVGGRGRLVRGCAQPGAGLLKSGRASPLVFNLLWIVAIIIRIISSR